jgi:hypothetical protein
MGGTTKAAAPARAPKMRTLAVQSARFISWKTVLVRNLGRELHTLHIQQQERAFMATSHGLTYASWGNETAAIH